MWLHTSVAVVKYEEVKRLQMSDVRPEWACPQVCRQVSSALLQTCLFMWSSHPTSSTCTATDLHQTDLQSPPQLSISGQGLKGLDHSSLWRHVSHWPLSDHISEAERPFVSCSVEFPCFLDFFSLPFSNNLPALNQRLLLIHLTRLHAAMATQMKKLFISSFLLN